jgi:hypothetical protein
LGFTIVEDLNALSGAKYAELFNVAEKIGVKILADLVRKKKLEKTNLVLPLERLSAENAPAVGGKAANLGEVLNRAHLPVPPGFASVMSTSILLDPLQNARLGGPSYAVVSHHYLNLNARLGYHFATIDTYCGPVINDNYLTFHFKGGAADVGRRSRRAVLLAEILSRMGFKVQRKIDLVRGQMKKYAMDQIAETLDMLGRLLGAVRLLDMVLADDRQVQWYVEEFFKGNYAFKKDFLVPLQK